MAVVKKCKKTGSEYIKFKCPNLSGLSPEQCVKKLNATFKKQIVPFAGVSIEDLFYQPNGDYKLYGKHSFQNTAGEEFYWSGVDTENWKGFSLIVYKKI